jgi:hypothetical protein
MIIWFQSTGAFWSVSAMGLGLPLDRSDALLEVVWHHLTRRNMSRRTSALANSPVVG